MQYLFNDEIKDKIKITTAEFQQLERQNILRSSQAKKGIQQRQKLIRLADQSEFSWDAVDEHEKDELAEDDKDAKCLEKVEKVASSHAWQWQEQVKASQCTVSHAAIFTAVN